MMIAIENNIPARAWRLLVLVTSFGIMPSLAGCRCGGSETTSTPDVVQAGGAQTAEVAAAGPLRTAGGVELPPTLPADAATALVRAPMDTNDAADALVRAGPSFAPLVRALIASPSMDDMVVGATALAGLAAGGMALELDPAVLQRLLDHPAPALATPALALAAAAGRHEVVIARLEAAETAPSVKLTLVDHLRAQASPVVLDALVRCITKENFAPVAEACAAAIADMRRPSGATEVLERLRGLRQLEPWTMPILVATSPIDAADPAADAARLDAILADAAAPQALRMLATRQRAEHPQTPPVLKRLQGASDLQFVGADALDDVPALTALVSDADPVVRAAAISALARLTPVEARRALLLPHLDDANAAVRRAAIATMAALLPLDEAVAVLSTRLRTTDDPDQGHIIAAIRTIPDRQAVDALIAALAEPHSRPGAWYALMTLSGEAPENADADYWRAWRDRRFGAPAP